MGGYRPKVNWFSPKAIKEPTPRVVEERVGPNSFRFRLKKKDEPNTLNTPMMDQGPLYEDYRRRKDKKNRNRHNDIETFQGRNNPVPNRHVNDHWTADDYYGIENTVHYNSNKYAWQPTRWSNWSYSSFIRMDDDDDSNMFVKSPENYLTPTVEQIRARTNFWTSEDIIRIKELSRVCYFKMIDEFDYIAEEYTDAFNSPITPEAWKKKKEMCDNVYTTYVPGFTPLEQAIAINHKINDMISKENKAKRKGNYRDDPRNFEFRRSDYADPYVNMQMELCDYNRMYRLDVLNFISIMGDLGSQFKVERAIGEQMVPYSDMTKSQLMSSYDQITMIDMYQRMLPGYNVKFLTKNLAVNVPIQSSEQKQKIIILLDFSASMNQTFKQIKVNSILADRFRYVMRGEAEVYFSYFVSSVDFLRFRHIKNQEDVEDFWKNHDNHPNGSYTNIGRIVKYVADEVKYGKLHNLNVDLSKELPEILIINDGEDEVGYKSFPYKVNAISLVNLSVELKDLCIASGGKQVYISGDDSIITHSNNGEEVISE